MKASRLLRASLSYFICMRLPLAGCAATKLKDGPPSRRQHRHVPSLPGDAVPRRSLGAKYGNGPVYKVLRQTLQGASTLGLWLPANAASPPGMARNFMAELTSSQEPYDMYAMTAAHKRCRFRPMSGPQSAKNNRSIVVRVNDRGPFVDNRLIDLSYSAALKLDMVRDGTSLVEVTAISFEELPRDVPVRNTTPAEPDMPATVSEPSFADTNVVYAQVGAFGSRENAQRRLDLIQQSGIRNSRIHEDRSGANLLYRVRIGPIREVLQYDLLVEELGNLGIEEPYLVTE